jgi:hypothetical protein
MLRVQDLRNVMNVDQPPLWENLRNLATFIAEILCNNDDGLLKKQFPMVHLLEKQHP